MKPADSINQLFRHAAVRTNPRMDETILDTVLAAQEKATSKDSAATRPGIRSTIMKSPIVKLAVAAVVIAVIGLGIIEFVTTGTKSGVVWAEVAQRVQASRSLVLRCTETTSFMPNNADYAIKYFCPTHSRTDSYQGGQLVQTVYDDFETKTITFVYHPRKHYMVRTFPTRSEGFLEKGEDWTNPRYMLQTILSGKHRELGLQTIDGIECEGIETTDPNVLGPLPGPVTRLEVEMRLWIDAKTQYPVRLEGKIDAEAEGESISSECVMDQFRWDVDLDPKIFEPNIPIDYEQI